MREQEDPTIVRESWLTEQSMSKSDYKALLAFLRYTPWGENWGGEQTYSRAPGLSLEELDRAWQIERWRFAKPIGNEYGTRGYGLPSAKGPNMLIVTVLLLLFGIAMAVLQRGSGGFTLITLAGLGIGAVMTLRWKPDEPYRLAKRAYEERRATLLAAMEQGQR